MIGRPPAVLRKRLDIQARTLTADGSGGQSESWAVAWRAVPFTLGTLSAQERDRYMRQGVTATHAAICDRDIAIVEQTHRLNDGGTIYDIVSVIDQCEIGGGRKLILERAR